MDTETIIKEQLEILPKEISDFFVNAKIDEQVSILGKNSNLNNEQLKILDTETTLLVLGLTNPDEFPNELKNRLKINNQILNDIVQKIISFIPNGIMEKLKETYKQRNEEIKKEKNKFNESIKEEITSLQKEKKEIINSFGWEKTLEEIGKDHNLTEDELDIIKKEICLILIEFRDKDFLSFSIEEDANIQQKKAEKIAEEINQKIFKPMTIQLIGNIKKNLPIRNIHWKQNLDFILSGGDYTAFIKRVENKTEEKNVLNIKNTFNPSKLDDLKSKFTI